MKLKDFIQDIGAVETRGPLDIDITAITSDSRAVTPGSLFIAVKGFASDGHKYIGQISARPSRRGLWPWFTRMKISPLVLRTRSK